MFVTDQESSSWTLLVQVHAIENQKNKKLTMCLLQQPMLKSVFLQRAHESQATTSSNRSTS